MDILQYIYKFKQNCAQLYKTYAGQTRQTKQMILSFEYTFEGWKLRFS